MKKKQEIYSLKKGLSVLNEVEKNLTLIRILLVGDVEEITIFLFHSLPTDEAVPTLSSFRNFVLQHKMNFFMKDYGIQFTVVPLIENMENSSVEYDFTIFCFNFSLKESFAKFHLWNKVIDANTNLHQFLVGIESESYVNSMSEKAKKIAEENERMTYWPFPSSYLNIVPLVLEQCFMYSLKNDPKWDLFPEFWNIYPHFWILKEKKSKIHELMGNLVFEIEFFENESQVKECAVAALKVIKNIKIEESDIKDGFMYFRLFLASCSSIQEYSLQVGEENGGIFGEILEQMLFALVKLYSLQLKRSNDISFLFERIALWIPHSKISFSMILCEIWMKSLKDISKKKRKKSKKKSKKKKEEQEKNQQQQQQQQHSLPNETTNSLLDYMDEVFDLTIRSISKEQHLRKIGQECGDETETLKILNYAMTQFTDFLFEEGHPSSLNIRFSKFICEILQLELLIGFDVIMYFFSKTKALKDYFALLEFLRVIVHHPYYIHYSSKRNCLSEILMEMFLKNVIHFDPSSFHISEYSTTKNKKTKKKKKRHHHHQETNNSSDDDHDEYDEIEKEQQKKNNNNNERRNNAFLFYNEFVKGYLELFFDHLYLGMLQSGIDPLKKNEDRRMEIALCYFPMIKKIALVNPLYIHLKESEEEKLSSILLFILQNLSSSMLMDYFHSNSDSLVGISRWMRFMIRSFFRVFDKGPSYFDYCCKIIDLFEMFCLNVIIGQEKSIFEEMLNFSFHLLELLKSQKNVFDYYVKNNDSNNGGSIFKRIVLGLRNVANKEDEGLWRLIVLRIINKYDMEIALFGKEKNKSEIVSSFEELFQKKEEKEQQPQEEDEEDEESLRRIMIDCLRDVLSIYLKDLEYHKLKVYKYEKEEIEKNILLNENLNTTIKAASIGKLMEYIIKSRSKMTEVFLTTHPLFIETKSLVNMFFTYYEYLNSQNNEKSIKEVVYLVKLWIRKYFYQFRNVDIALLLYLLYFKKEGFQDKHLLLLRKTIIECLTRKNHRYLPRMIEDWAEWDEQKQEEGEMDNNSFVTDSFAEDQLPPIRGRINSSEERSSTSSDLSTASSSPSSLSMETSSSSSSSYSQKKNSSSSSSSYEQQQQQQQQDGGKERKEWYEESCKSILPKKLMGGRTKKIISKVEKMKSWEELTDFIFKFDPLEIARQLSLIDFVYFKSVSSVELVFHLHPSLGESPNLHAFEERSKKLTLWIDNIIISKKTEKKRIEISRKLLSLLKEMKHLGNYYAVGYILKSLESTPIERLIHPKHIDPKIKLQLKIKENPNDDDDHEFSIVNELSKLLQEKEGESLRNLLKDELVAIPLWNVYQIKLIQIEKMNPDRFEMKKIEEKKEEEKQNDEKDKVVKLISVNKQRKIFDVLTKIKNFQNQTIYDKKIKRVDALCLALMRIMEFFPDNDHRPNDKKKKQEKEEERNKQQHQARTFLSKDEIYRKSYEYKPKSESNRKGGASRAFRRLSMKFMSNNNHKKSN